MRQIEWNVKSYFLYFNFRIIIITNHSWCNLTISSFSLVIIYTFWEMWFCFWSSFNVFFSSMRSRAPEVAFLQPKVPLFFLFLHENICCGYSLEVPLWGTSNEYTQHVFSWKNKKNTYLICPLRPKIKKVCVSGYLTMPNFSQLTLNF